MNRTWDKRMKPLPLIAAGAALVVGIGAVAVSSSFIGSADDTKTPAPVQVAQATTAETESKTDADAPSASDTSEESKTMSDETAEKTPEEAEAFRQTMHEGDVALGVCGARVSALLWFYEASVAQGRDDLKTAVESLTQSRESIKAEAERRAVDDKVDTSVRVMNAESEKMWDALNEKASGDAEEFQKAHDELFSGVQECLSLFFERPEGEKAE
jgi:hypothetical protein